MITREILAKVMTFNPEIGRFHWNGVARGQPAGKECGSVDAHGYGQIRVFGEIWKEHHLVWLWAYGELPVTQIDHINHIRRDNRVANLRAVDNTENHKNRPRQRNNSSGRVGVAFEKQTGRYEAYIAVAGKRIRLGRFSTVEEASAARLAAERQYGYHENHGEGISVPKRKMLRDMKKEAGNAP